MSDQAKYPVNEQVAKQIRGAFTYHPPHGDQVQRYSAIRDQARVFSKFLSENCPHGRELSLALTSLEQVVMWANAAIARGESEQNTG
jgi:hypothetical protein